MQKKIIVMFLCAMVMCILTACAETSNNKTEETLSVTTEENLTTTEEITTQVETTEITTEEDAGYDKSAISQNWDKSYYVDDWGDATSDAYLIYETQDGSFSDSAAVDSNLTAGVIVDLTDLQFVFMKYGSNYYIPISDVTYTMAVKDENGNVKTFSAWQNAGDERVYTSDTSSIVAMLKTPGTYSFCFESEELAEKFVFKVNSDNFLSAYNGL
jgi:hypothetical protein